MGGQEIRDFEGYIGLDRLKISTLDVCPEFSDKKVTPSRAACLSLDALMPCQSAWQNLCVTDPSRRAWLGSVCGETVDYKRDKLPARER